ncbi:unnamed protein product, partial [Ixodes hexagonus]
MSWFGLLASFACLMYIVYYLFRVVQRPWFICKSGRFREHLSAYCGRFLEECFWPPFWCITPNVQCLVGLLFQRWQRRLPFRRQLLRLSDGAVVALDWLNEGTSDGPVLLFLTGLTSDSQVYYLRTLLPRVAAMGHPCVVFNNRGQGDLPLLNHKLVCGLSIDDLAEVIAAIKERSPDGPLFAVGYSLGGVLLSHYLRLKGDDARIDAAVAISTPFHLATSRKNLMSWSASYFLNIYLAYWLVRCLRKNRDVLLAS